jgi:hypothetical protein
MTRPGLGRHPHWDPKNEKYKLHVPILRRLGFAIARTLGIPQPRSWRQWKYWDQGNSPECTAFGSATFLAADPTHEAVSWLRVLDVHRWYLDNVAEDKAHGRVFSEGGATTLAAMEVGKRRGYWDRYEWALSFDAVIAHLHNEAPIIAGTNWHRSMFDRDAEGIVRLKPGSPIDGGHLYTLGAEDPRYRIPGEDARRGLATIRQTWGDGDYKIPLEDLERLYREDGEFAFPHKLKVA